MKKHLIEKKDNLCHSVPIMLRIVLWRKPSYIGIKRLSAVWLLLLLGPWLLLSSNTLVYDPSGGGKLSGLNVGSADTPITPNSYISGSFTGKEGYLGRYVYHGEPNITLTFTNLGSQGLGNKFYYTRLNNTTVYREFFIVARILGLKHNGGTPVALGNNVIIVNSNETVTIPSGAGDELIPDPNVSFAYNKEGGWGKSKNHIYKYQYKDIWIELTVIRTNNNNLPFLLAWGGFESQIAINGTDISTALNVSGYYFWRYGEPGSYLFSVERTCPPVIPIDELFDKKTPANSYLVGYVRYNSKETAANLYFASDAGGTAADFRFTSGANSFPYYVAYYPITPTGTVTKVDSPSKQFSSTKIDNDHIIYGEIRIYVGMGANYYSMPADTYSSKIYCFISTN